MKPLQLKIRGINSFTAEQVIDFDKLTGNGLFGIFGPTGSGKSTVLDAITKALYDKMPRNSDEFVNKELSTAQVSFTFSIGSSLPCRYVAQRSYKTDPKTGRVKNVHARLIEEHENGYQIVIAEKSKEMTAKIEQIIGLGYEDFTRCVVLPQGKFSEFLTLTGQKRREMLERVFQLEPFGLRLHKKIRTRLNHKETELQILDAALLHYQHVDSAQLKQLKQHVSELENELAQIQKQLMAESTAYEDMKKLWALFQQKKEYEQKQQLLENDSAKRAQYAQMVTQASNAALIMPHILNAKEKQSILKTIKERILKTQNECNQLNVAIKVNDDAHQQATALKNEQYPILIRRIAQFKQAVQIAKELTQYQTERDALAQLYKDEFKVLQANKQQTESIKQTSTNLEQQLSDIRNQKQALFVSAHVREEAESAATVENEIQTLIHTMEENQKKTAQYQKEYEEITTLYQKKNLNLETQKAQHLAQQQHLEALLSQWHTFLLTQVLCCSKQHTKLLQEHESVEQQLKDLELHDIASKLSAQLRDGLPCPVCGSFDHSNAQRSQAHESESESAKLNNRLIELKSAIRKIEHQKISTEQTLAQIEEEVQLIEKPVRMANLDNINDSDCYQKAVKAAREKLSDSTVLIHKTQLDLLSVQQETAVIKTNLDNAKTAANLVEKLDQLKQTLAQYQHLIVDTIFISENKPFHALLESFKQNIRKIESLDGSEQALTKQHKVQAVELEALNQSIRQNEQELARIETSGKEKKEVLTKRQADIENITGGKDAHTLLEAANAESEQLLKNERQLEERKQTLWQQLTQLSNNLHADRKEEQMTQEMADREHSSALALMAEKHFDSFDSVEAATVSAETMLKKEQFIKHYDTQKSAIEKALDTINESINDNQLDEDTVKEQESVVKKLQDGQLQLREQLAVLLKQTMDMEKDLKIAETKRVQRLQIEKTLNQLNQLASLFAGNRFVEFVAESRLNYVARQATTWLKQMSGGRYAIELDETSFIIRDDANGGVRRSPQTLSGGELFITSLCLALALSSRIQLTNDAPLEFFFLDEGFGSLDNDAIEVVMNALEQLRSCDFSIGLITHVKAIKHAISAKLLVIPPEQGLHGSLLKIEIS